MIRVPGFRGAAFTAASDGDAGTDEGRRAISGALGITSRWALVRQVHGADVMTVTEAGVHGAADAVVTATSGLPVAVRTADCVPIVLEAPGAVAVTHAGWRGLAAGVVEATIERLTREGGAVSRVAIGPAIGSCCFEVGPEVLAEFPASVHDSTTWGTPSVDLVADVRRRVGPDLEVWSAGECTRCSDRHFSHRRDATKARQVGLGWMP